MNSPAARDQAQFAARALEPERLTVRLVRLGEERDRLAFAARTTGSSYTVDVLGPSRVSILGLFGLFAGVEGWKRTHVFNRQRERLVDNQLDLGDVESTSGNVCNDEG